MAGEGQVQLGQAEGRALHARLRGLGSLGFLQSCAGPRHSPGSTVMQRGANSPQREEGQGVVCQAQRKPGRFPVLKPELKGCCGPRAQPPSELQAWQGPFPVPLCEHLLQDSAAFTSSIPTDPHSHLQGEFYHPSVMGEETEV